MQTIIHIILTVALLYGVMHLIYWRTSRPPSKTAGYDVIGYNIGYKIVMLVVLLMGLCLSIFAFFPLERCEGSEVVIRVLCGLLFGAAGLGAWLDAFFSHIRFNDREVIIKTPWRGTRQTNWNDISGWRTSFWFSGLIFQTQSIGNIYFSDALYGKEEFLDVANPFMYQIHPERFVAEDFAVLNQKSIEGSQRCGCFNCLKIYAPNDVIDWCDNDYTAICPYCKACTVIGDASDYPISQVSLQAVKDWTLSGETIEIKE